MGVSGALRTLADFVDECAAAGRVVGVDLCTDSDDVRAHVEVRFPVAEGGTSIETHVEPDGAVRWSFETAALPSAADAVTCEAGAPTVHDDGTLEVTLTASVPTSTGVATDTSPGREDGESGPSVADLETVTVAETTTHETVETTDDGDGSERASPDTDTGSATVGADADVTTDTGSASDDSSEVSPDDDTDPDGPVGPDEAAGGDDLPTVTRHDPDVPPFKDQAFLEEVYEVCDTFAEMPEVLGMDVTAETVRRYMIDYDIHEPNSYDTGEGPDAGESGPQDPVVLADGIGLPDDVTVDTFIETVRTSNTIYEVKEGIGIEREDALEMLQDLNLLEIVIGRLGTEAQRDISRDTVVERLRQHADPQ